MPQQSPVSPPTDPLALFILTRPGMAETLLTVHRDDRFTWPCRTSSAATAAAEYLSQVAARQQPTHNAGHWRRRADQR